MVKLRLNLVIPQDLEKLGHWLEGPVPHHYTVGGAGGTRVLTTADQAATPPTLVHRRILVLNSEVSGINAFLFRALDAAGWNVHVVEVRLSVSVRQSQGSVVSVAAQ